MSYIAFFILIFTLTYMNAVVRLNLDVSANDPSSSLRVKRAIESLKNLYPKFKRIVILSHRGRPEGVDKKLSLRPVIKDLSLKLNKNIIFLDKDPEYCAKTIIDEKKGIFALENTRFLEGENLNNSSLSRIFASLGDIFINDDFATAHRKQSSNVGIAKFLPCFEGPIMKKEINNLKKAVNFSSKSSPVALIIGGGKISTKLPVIKHLISKVDYILLGGGAGNTALKAAGYDIKNSICEESLVLEIKKIINNPKIILPCDFKIFKNAILDIGPNTIDMFSEIISNSKTVIWSGPLGMFEKRRFSEGTRAVAGIIAKSDCFSVAGGGETTSAIISYGLENKFSFLSTGGGAMLEFLSGKKLPALEVLKLNIN